MVSVRPILAHGYAAQVPLRLLCHSQIVGMHSLYSKAPVILRILRIASAGSNPFEMPTVGDRSNPAYSEPGSASSPDRRSQAGLELDRWRRSTPRVSRASSEAHHRAEQLRAPSPVSRWPLGPPVATWCRAKRYAESRPLGTRPGHRVSNLVQVGLRVGRVQPSECASRRLLLMRGQRRLRTLFRHAAQVVPPPNSAHDVRRVRSPLSARASSASCAC